MADQPSKEMVEAAIQRELIERHCTSPDGTMVHAPTDAVLRSVRAALSQAHPAADRAEIVRAARALIAKLDYVHAHPTYASVWTLAQVHSAPYAGPTYTEELAALRRSLASAPGKKEEGE